MSSQDIASFAPFHDAYGERGIWRIKAIVRVGLFFELARKLHQGVHKVDCMLIGRDTVIDEARMCLCTGDFDFEDADAFVPCHEPHGSRLANNSHARFGHGFAYLLDHRRRSKAPHFFIIADR